MSTFKKGINSYNPETVPKCRKRGRPSNEFHKTSIILIPQKNLTKKNPKEGNLKINYHIKYGSKIIKKLLANLIKPYIQKNNTLCPMSIISKCANIVQYYEIIDLIHHSNRSK